ncbi:hypothetical protein ACHAWO_012360 [Cyclotella atomus]|uniref:Uncharacterized protein n=1 Tax=Cyclotella atomus TaxID=382360 RepID=A0ABD3Q2Y9_9STRA
MFVTTSTKVMVHRTGLILLLLGNSRAFLPHRQQRHIQHSFQLLSTESATDGADSTAAMFWRARQDCWRPDIRDVEKISWGMPAKKKGTGSRGTPHRLNEEERRAFDQARRQGFLQVKGSSWRSQRRDAPLLNSYRSLMDARGRPAIVLHKLNPTSGITDGEDMLVVDLSTLRYPDEFGDIAQKVKERVYSELQIRADENVEKISAEEEDETLDELRDNFDRTMYETRPIYQLPSYSICFKATRQEGKEIGKLLAFVFDTVEEKATKLEKPKGVKPGKSRRHGGYGIG